MKHRRRLPFPILFEDDFVLVVSKPAGLLTTHTKLAGRIARETQLTAENILNDYVRKGQMKSRKRVWLVHRLDRETSGVMMFAKSAEVADRMRSDWSNLTEKTYLARVEGTMSGKSGVFESHLLEDSDGYRVRSVPEGRGGKCAKTEWKVVSESRGTSLVEVKLHTGRKNQIRVHMKDLGHPVAGDKRYDAKTDPLGRLCLHAGELILRHPVTGEELTFRARTPKEFHRLFR